MRQSRGAEVVSESSTVQAVPPCFAQLVQIATVWALKYPMSGQMWSWEKAPGPQNPMQNRTCKIT